MSKEDEIRSTISRLQYSLHGDQLTQLPPVWHDDMRKAAPTNPQYAQKQACIPRIVSTDVILAAWAFVLSHFTASEDVAYGLSLEEGSDASSEGTTVYLFRLSLPLNDSLEQLTRSVTKSLHQSKASPGRGTPINQAYRSGTLLQILRPKSTQDGYTSDNDTRYLDVPLKVSFQEVDCSTNVIIAFQQHLHTHEYVEELLRQTTEIVPKLLSGLGSPPHHVNLDLLLSWTQPCEPKPQHPLLHTGIERQSRLTPTAIAIGQSECVMTYRELNLGSDLLAESLGEILPAEQKACNVGIYFEKSAFAIMSMLAVLKAGSTYVPLDVAWPQQRVASVVRNARISVVFCSKTQGPRLQDHTLRTVFVDESSVHEMKKRSHARARGQQQRCDLDSSRPAYMLYTSGSTGVPKGIPVSHLAISTSIQAMARHLGIGAKTRTFQYTTFTFDLNIADIWMTLSHGGRICLPTEDERLDPSEFIAQERCNYAMMTPTAASTIDVATLHANIKTLALIGETVPEPLLRRIATPDGSLELYNTWGPTEACVIASRSKNIAVTDGCHLSVHPNDIGRPVGCSIFLVSVTDPHQLAPAFAPGEIALVGHTLADGYFDNPAKTGEAFRTDLEWTRNESIIARVGSAAALETAYLTGDIGRYNPSGDGSIIFMHRKEGGYVKINGYRVDPGEVEASVIESGLSSKGICILSHDLVDTESPDARQVLVCFFVAGHGHAKPGVDCEVLESDAKTTEAVRQTVAHLRESVPEYMIPRLFVPLVSIPILTSHKIDRKSLLGTLNNRSWPDLVRQFGA